jgi:hypothetical protein
MYIPFFVIVHYLFVPTNAHTHTHTHTHIYIYYSINYSTNTVTCFAAGPSGRAV